MHWNLTIFLTHFDELPHDNNTKNCSSGMHEDLC